MTVSDFEKLVEEAIAVLPEKLRRELDNVAIVVEDERSPNEDLLGLYEGVPRVERGEGYDFTIPDKITIYKKDIEEDVVGEEEIPALVRRVVWHEIGHHFGFSEEKIAKLERDWEAKKLV